MCRYAFIIAVVITLSNTCKAAGTSIIVKVGTLTTRFEFKPDPKRPSLDRLSDRNVFEKALLEQSDLKDLGAPLKLLRAAKPHEERFCRGKLVDIAFSQVDRKVFCLESKTAAGEEARKLTRRLELAVKLRARRK